MATKTWPCVIVISFLLPQMLSLFSKGYGGLQDHDDGEQFNILMISIPLRGHVTPMLSLGEELHNRGHVVTLVSLDHNNLEEVVSEKGMRFINAGPFPFDKEQLNALYLKSMDWDDKALFTMFSEQITPIIKYVYNSINFSDWDIVIGEDFITNSLSCLIKMQGSTQLPILSVVPRADLLPMYLNRSPWLTPPPMSPLLSIYPEQMDLMQRLSLILQLAVQALSMDAVIWNLYYPSFIREDCKQVHYTHSIEGHEFPVLLASVIGMESSRTIGPLMHYIGPIYPRKMAKGLPVDLERWLHSKRQCIVISMGSMASVSYSFIDQVIQSIAKTNYSVIWSLKKHKELLANVSYDRERFFISDWIPQFDLMQHDSTILAILHGGMGGINDALYNAVPIICMPFGGDQGKTCFRIQELELGIMLDRKQQTPELIYESIQTILTDDKYSRNCIKMSKLLRAGGGVAKAIELIELYASVGYDHLIPSYVKYKWSWIVYYNIDVYLAIVLILVIVVTGSIYCCGKLFRIMCCCCCRCFQ